MDNTTPACVSACRVMNMNEQKQPMYLQKQKAGRND